MTELKREQFCIQSIFKLLIKTLFNLFPSSTAAGPELLGDYWDDVSKDRQERKKDFPYNPNPDGLLRQEANENDALKRPFSSRERPPSSRSASSSHRHHGNHHPKEKHNHTRHQKHHHNQDHQHQQKKNRELEKHRRKLVKEKYQRKVERAHKMQLQREQKLEYQRRQLAEYEKQQSARQKVYFGNFAQQNQQFDSVADIDQHIDGGAGPNGGNKDRYPNLSRLQTQLKEDQDKELPPYVRKYNRRNKQLFDLIEGTHSPAAKSHPVGQQHQPKSPLRRHSTEHLSHKEKLERWMEENLFEEQRRNPNQILKPPSVEEEEEALRNKLNALPGELGPAAGPDEGHLMAPVSSMPPAPQVNLSTNRLSPQTRAGNFVYHRIAQSQPSNAIGQAFGVIVRKPGLPFVAITDRRQEMHKPKHL